MCVSNILQLLKCYTGQNTRSRHDYGLDKREGAYAFEAGMTKQEREALYRQMAQIFDNCIQPYMEFKP